MTRRSVALVTGASGFIGRALVERLADAPFRVVALTRRPSIAMQPDVEVRTGNLVTGEGITDRLVADVDHVFHCAGEVNEPALMRQLHVDGTRRLLRCVREVADRRGAPIHWIQLSSVGAYGPARRAGAARRVDENTPECPASDYELTKTEADHLVWDAASRGIISCSTLRPSNVIGARMPNGSVRRLLSLVGCGWFFHVGEPGAIANYVHVCDVASALLTCATHTAARGELFTLSSDCTWERLIHHVACLYGIQVPRRRLPEGVLRALAVAVGPRLGNPLTAARIDALVNRTTYPPTKIESRLGFKFAKPLPQGIDDLVANSV